MADSFKKLKEGSKDGTALRRVLNIVHASQRPRVPKRVFKALNSYGYHELAEKINGCARGRYCSSVYCSDCRNRAANSLNNRVLKHCRMRFGNDDEKATTFLRYVTVCCELTGFDVDEVREATKRARKNINALRRRFPQIWMKGAFEYEVISMGILTGDKQKTLNALATGKSDNQVLVHFHALLDIKDYDVVEIRSWIGQRWAGYKRCEIKKTFVGQNIADKCRKTSSYPFKQRTRLNPTFRTYDYKEGEYLTVGSLAKLVKIYDGMGDRGYASLLIDIGN